MISAIHGSQNWSSGNTQVVTNDDVSTVYLHGNKIALVDNSTVTIFDGGWQSNTTKSRLNALITEFCNFGEGVFQKDFLWYVRKYVGIARNDDGQPVMTDDGHMTAVYNDDDFHSGYVFTGTCCRYH